MHLTWILLSLFAGLAACNADEAIFNPFLLTIGDIFPQSHSGVYQGRAFIETTFTQKLDHVDLFEVRTWEQVSLDL